MMKFDWKDAWFYAEKMVTGVSSEIELKEGECEASRALDDAAARMYRAAEKVELAYAELFSTGQLLEKAVIKHSDYIMSVTGNRIARLTKVAKMLHEEKKRRPSTNRALERENRKLRLQ